MSITRVLPDTIAWTSVAHALAAREPFGFLAPWCPDGRTLAY
jgi:hypothetical protein